MKSEAYVTKETASLLEQVGFPQGETMVIYECDRLVERRGWHTIGKWLGDKFLDAPSQAMAARYLREVYGVHVSPRYCTHEKRHWWVCDVIPLHYCDVISDHFCCERTVCSHFDAYTTPEPAMEQGLIQACKYIILYKQGKYGVEM